MRVVVGVLLLVFGWGAVVHVGQLVGMVAPTVPLPGWLAVFFGSLVVLDPLVFVLVWLRLRVGLALGAAVLGADAAANGWANHVLDPATGVTAGRVGQAVITLLAVGLLVALPWVWPWARPLRRRPG